MFMHVMGYTNVRIRDVRIASNWILPDKLSIKNGADERT